MARAGDDPILGVFPFAVPRAHAQELTVENPLVQAGRLRWELLW